MKVQTLVGKMELTDLIILLGFGAVVVWTYVDRQFESK